jgi:hypothetical protein
MNNEKVVKTGKEIVDTFFQNISSIDGVDVEISNALIELYNNGKFTDTNVINKIRELREKNGD